MLLVTGITGHTGRYFLQELIDHKYEGTIRCIVRETSETSILDKSGLIIEKVYGDLNNKKFITKVMNGTDSIIHIYNIHHSPIIVEAAIEQNVKRVILVHTTGIYSNFKNASQEYKDIEEKVSKLTSKSSCPTKITILRPTMIYGDLCDSNMSKFIKIIDRFRVVPVINSGRSLIQPVNARDLGKAYDLSGERPLQMIEVFKIISDNLNKKTFFISIPLEFGLFLARIAKIFSLGKVDFIEKVQRMAEDRSYSHEDASNDFNYKPMSFDKVIKMETDQYLTK